MAMHTWFECRIRYEKMMDNGMQKKVTEPYLVDALSFTEAEARIIEEMTPSYRENSPYRILNVLITANCSLVMTNRMIRWFKCKLVFITLDEKSGAEKCTSTYVLVQASDLDRAKKNLDEAMKGNNGGLSGSCGNGDGYYGCLSVYGIR